METDGQRNVTTLQTEQDHNLELYAQNNKQLSHPFDFQHHQVLMEDGKITRVFFDRFIKFEQCCAYFNCIGLLQSVYVYDMEHRQEYPDIKEVLLWTIFANTAMLVFLTLLRYKSLLDWEQERGTVPKSLNFVTSGYLFYYLAEMILLSLIPNIWSQGVKLEFFNDVQGMEAYYYLNEIFCLLMVLRVFVIVRTLLLQTKWYTNRAQRVCGFYACEANYMFIVKSLMRTQPYLVIFTALIAMVVFFGYAIRICELPLNRNDTSSNDFDSYWNAFWYIIVTQVTLGYGDLYARTPLGRFVILLVCIVGTFVISMMVVTLTNSLMTNSLESKAITVLQRIMVRKKMIKEAASILTIMAKIGLGQRHGTLTLKQYHMYAIKMQDVLRRFKVTRRNYKCLQDGSNILEDLNREFFLLRDDFKQIQDKQDEIIGESENIIGLLNPVMSKIKKVD